MTNQVRGIKGGVPLLTAAILFGIVVGTYSSIYVAGALLIYLPQVTGREEPAVAPPGAAPRSR